MTKETFTLLENYMLSCMEDAAHDRAHIDRVLFNALAIAEGEAQVDEEVLIAACLLHDIARKDQLENPAICHAALGAERAEAFLVENGFGEGFAAQVKACIYTHRFRKAQPPQSVEARILFDADKLDATGAIGIARTLQYKGTTAAPLYSFRKDGRVSDGREDESPSFFQEYCFKLEKLYDRFYTEKGKQMAEERRAAAVHFYESLFSEVSEGYESGSRRLEELIGKK